MYKKIIMYAVMSILFHGTAIMPTEKPASLVGKMIGSSTNSFILTGTVTSMVAATVLFNAPQSPHKEELLSAGVIGLGTAAFSGVCIQGLGYAIQYTRLTDLGKWLAGEKNKYEFGFLPIISTIIGLFTAKMHYNSLISL